MTTAVTSATRPAGPAAGAGWRVAAALVALALIPLTAGTLRLIQLAGGPEVMPADDRFGGFPVALVVHIAGSAVFVLVGSLQFVGRFRSRHWAWHRRAGRLLVVAGLAVAGSALWLTLVYSPHPGTGPVLYVARLVVGSSMAVFLVLGLAAIRRRDVGAHRAWMVRTYALALGAGTQALTEGLTEGVLGSGELRGDLAKVAGWGINLAVAEWVLRHPASRRTR